MLSTAVIGNVNQAKHYGQQLGLRQDGFYSNDVWNNYLELSGPNTSFLRKKYGSCCFLLKEKQHGKFTKKLFRMVCSSKGIRAK
jgi:hypothetical protein